jgi:hypothetical protein
MRRTGYRTIIAALALCSLLPAQHRSKRLVLKDGSYQPVIQYEIKGDRVHYLSAERNEWEDVPTTLVDWDATNQFNQELQKKLAEMPKLSAEDETENNAEALTPTVAPGIRLPAGDGVYLLDEYDSAKQLIEVTQSNGDIRKNVGRNILIAAINPVATSKESIEIKGAHAAVQAHPLQPALYVNISEDDHAVPDDSSGQFSRLKAPPLSQRYRLVRAEVKKDRRVIGNLKIAFYGKVRQQGNWVETLVTPEGSAWAKVTPAAPLAPGEYALVEMLGDHQMNFFVWDFGVNPSAAANAATWAPVQSKQPPVDTEKAPALATRPKQ